MLSTVRQEQSPQRWHLRYFAWILFSVEEAIRPVSGKWDIKTDKAIRRHDSTTGKHFAQLTFFVWAC